MSFTAEVLESEDGGRTCWEAVVTVRDVNALVSNDSLKIGNIRPDHELIGYEADGVTPRYANTSERISKWSEALIDGTAILGNLTWNLNPDLTTFSVDRGEDGRLYLTLTDGAFDTEIDSASRHRAVMRALRHVRIANGTTGAADRLMDRKLSVRIYNVRSKHGGSTEIDPDDLITEELFTAYQNWGQSVNQSVTKYNFQSTPQQKLMRRAMDLTEHLDGNVETDKNSVSRGSDKIVAFNTWSMAGENFWRVPLPTEQVIEREAQWLAEWWNELVRIRPELGTLSVAHRKEYRDHLVSVTALGFFGFVGLASRMRGEGADFAKLEQLAKTVTLSRAGITHEKDAEVDFFDFDNPIWEERGILVRSRDPKGKNKLSTRNNWQSRREIVTVVLALCGFAT